MKAILLCLMSVFGVFIMRAGSEVPATVNEAAGNSASAMVHSDTTDFDKEAALKALRKEIEGMEDEPAGEVFLNITHFKGVSAGRLLNIMDRGFSNSLGISCNHCHNTSDYASDEKEEKIIARKMMDMTGRINRELLPDIEELSERDALVNCSTCHRGDTKPALSVDR